MKIRTALPLLLTLLFLGLAGTSALASIFSITTQPPETPSPVGFGPLGPPTPDNPIPAISWNCPFAGGCNVTGFSYGEFAENANTSPNPFLMNEVWFGSTPYSTNFAAFSAPVIPGNISGLGCFSISVTTWCNQTIDLAGAGFPSIHVNQGTVWVTLYGENINNAGDNFWASSGNTNIISTTLSQDPHTGVITLFPSQLTFTVTGTAVPEPSSMLLFGSGVLGLVGVLRRKLMR